MKICEYFHFIKLTTFFILYPLLFSHTKAQDPQFEFALQLGGTDGELARSIKIDATGNIYTTGDFRGTCDFDPGTGVFNMTGNGNSDIYITKLNDDGSFQWAKQIGGPQNDIPTSIFLDDANNIYITGEFKGTCDFDPGSGSYNMTSTSTGLSTNVFIVKLDEQGEFIWAKQFGGVGNCGGYSVAVDAGGSVFTTGRFNASTDFDPGSGTFNLTTTPTSNPDVFISKLNSSGGFVWAKKLGGTGNDIPYSLVLDVNSNVFTTGQFAVTADFDPGTGTYNLTTFGILDAFISKLDASGNFVWAKQMGGTQVDYTRSIAINDDGDIFVTGDFAGTADFDPGSSTYNFTSFGLVDGFIASLDNNGDFRWASQIGGVETERPFAISVDNEENVFSTGIFYGLADFDPGSDVFNLTPFGGADIYISQLDNMGNFVWAGQLGGPAFTENGYCITTDDDGNIYTGGDFSETTDFDPGVDQYQLTSFGNSTDIFISKLNRTVCEGVMISTHPISQNSNTCEQVTFSVSATGDSPFSYTWYKNGVIIPDEDEATYLTPLLNLSDDGNTYHCVVTNCSGENMQTSETALLSVINCVSSSPSIRLNHSVISPGESLTITGSDFSEGGTIVVTVNDRFNHNIASGIPITYMDPGKFSLTIPIPLTLFPDNYTIVALDMISGITAPQRSFLVNNQLFNEISIISPESQSTVYRGIPTNISWRDDINLLNSNIESGFATKSYQIEISTDLGNSWHWLKNMNARAYANQINTFSTQFILTDPDVDFIKFRVTDIDLPVNTDETGLIEVGDCPNHGFTYSLHWDQTVTGVFKNPIGLAADGTARLLMKITKNPFNNKEVNAIEVNLESNGNTYEGPGLVGKVMYAFNPLSYTEEANSANSTSIVYPALSNNNQNANSYWFWLVAPDDFTSDLDEVGSERFISATFYINYTDNSIDTITSCPPISIFRPGLVFVHGLFSDPDAWKKTAYITDEQDTIDYINSTEWKVLQRINLHETAHFEVNADVLMEKGLDEDNGLENSIKHLLYKMHSLGIANKRIDYVCHSMGGSVGRTVINEGGNWYCPGVGRFKNYSKGYINKFITICTPHNGSYLADFLIDAAILAGNTLGNTLFNEVPGLNFVWDQIGEDILYELIPGAGRDLQSYSGGKVLNATNIRNHLISADLDQNNNLEEIILLNQVFNGGKEFTGYNILKFLYSWNSLEYLFNFLYQNDEFFSQTDGIVQLTSQLAGKNYLNAVNLNTNMTGVGQTSIIYGIEKDHVGIQEDVTVGTRVKRLLNASIFSNFFDMSIPANSLPQHPQASLPNANRAMLTDSILNRIDTQFIKITNPTLNSLTKVDSTLNIIVHVKDFDSFENLRILFQSEIHISEETDEYQAFHLQVQPNYFGKNEIIALAEYDSSGFTVNHIDTVSIMVGSLDTIDSFYVIPASINLNPDQKFEPQYFAVYPTFIGAMKPSINGLTYEIADTNVIFFDTISRRFIANDLGSTHIIFTYEDISDTIFIYISYPIDNNIVKICELDSSTLYAGFMDPEKDYQWQIDSLGVFENLSDNTNLTGTQTHTLLLYGIPTRWYNYKFKCIIYDSLTQTESDIYTLKFESIWTGLESVDWENPSNWSCMQVPDEFTDVIVNNSSNNHPEVNSFAVCRRIKLIDNSTITIQPGYELHITGNDD